MFVLGIWLSVLLAVLALLVSAVATALDRDELLEASNESLTFLRLTLTGFFGVVLTQSLATLNLRWWVVGLIVVPAMLMLLVGSQIAARVLGLASVGKWLATRMHRIIRSLDLLFTPLALPKVDKPDEFEQELLESVDEFGETIVREIMVPRIDMLTVRADQNLQEAFDIFLDSGISRAPATGRNIDDVVGILYLKDVARQARSNSKALSKLQVQRFLRPVIFVPDSKPVDDLLRELQLKATHIAIVIDEYGGVAGLVTMEDVIEEIVGDISDEYDRNIADVQELPAGVLRVSAKYSLADLGERFELDIEDEVVDSVGGILTKELGRLPRRGDSVVYSGLKISVDRIEGRNKRLVSVLVEPDESLKSASSAFEGGE